MSRSSKIIIAVLAALLLGCGAFFLFAPDGGSRALIYLDGELYQEVELDSVRERYTIPVGEGNLVLIEPGGISMHSADCPDQLCVKQGRATVLQPVVCLPNRVTIIVEDPAEAELDVIIGGGGA